VTDEEKKEKLSDDGKKGEEGENEG